MLETLSSIMREPIKIDTSSLQAEKTVRAPESAQSQDNITNIIIVIEIYYVNFQIMKDFYLR